MEDKLLKLVGLAFGVFVAIAIVFQIAEQLDAFARGIACAAGIGVMVGLPICVLRTFFGPDAQPRPGTWGGLVAVIAIFAFSLSSSTGCLASLMVEPQQPWCCFPDS